MAPRDAIGSRLLSGGRSQPRRRPLLLATSALVVFGLGMGAGRLSDGGSSSSDPPLAPVEPRTTAPTVTERPAAEIPRSPRGAARAAATALTALADSRLLSSPRTRRAAIASLATPRYGRQLQSLFDRTYGYLSGLLGGSGRRGDILLRMAPVGYRVEAFSGRRASVAVWQVTLLATPERAPIAAWSTSRAELAWSGGRWRVTRFGADAPGPVPSITAPSTAGAPAEFVSAAAGFAPFRP